MKLWTVTVSDDLVILAESAEAAERIAMNVRHEAEIMPGAAAPMSFIPAGWVDDSTPFGSGGKRLDELIASGHAPEYVAMRRILNRGQR